MADVKISELTALTSPDGAEELVVNDGGTTKKITITNATSASLAKSGGTMTGAVTSNSTFSDLDGNVRSGRKNMVINGGMQVAQRGTSSAGLGADATTYLLDRWAFGTGGTAGRLTMSQDSDGPAGFANSLKLDCTTADTSIAAGEQSYLIYKFEGQDLQQLKKGTSSAESMTLSFYVKGNAAATYTAEFYDADNNRHNGQTFSVTASWNRITLTYVPDTTGAYNDDNALSLYLFIWIHAGTTMTSGTFTSNTWSASASNTRVSSSNTSFFDSTSRTLNITGVQLEVGSTATDFEHRSYGEELRLCERYFYRYTGATQERIYNENNGATAKWWFFTFPQMRATPSATFSSGWVGGSIVIIGGTISSMGLGGASPTAISFRVNNSGAGGDAKKLYHTDSFSGDYCYLSAEL